MRAAVLTATFVASTLPALALDLPARTPGLWVMEIAPPPELAAYNLPPPNLPATKQCIDAGVDQRLWQRDLGGERDAARICQAANISISNGTITSEVSCNMGPISVQTRMVVSGDFTRAYTMRLTSRYQPEGPQAQRVPPGGFEVKTTYRYVGACEADQRPGDFITGDGRTIHLLDGPKPGDRR